MSRGLRYFIPRLARWAGVGVFVLGAGIIVSCGDDGPTGPEPVKSVWEWVPTPKCLAPVNDIYFVSANDGWAVAGHQIWHYDGSSWKLFKEFHPPDPRNDIAIGSLWFNGADDGWAGGAEVIPGNKFESKLWHYKGGKWEETAHPESEYINGFWFFGGNNGYAFTGDYVLRYDGRRWIKGEYYTGNLFHFFFWNENDGWANNLGEIWRWDGVIWERVYWVENWLHCIGFATRNKGWAMGEWKGGSPYTWAYIWDGTEWQADKQFNNSTMYDIQFLNGEYGWAVGIGTWHWDGYRWTRYDKPWSGEDGRSFDCQCLFALSENDVWAGGDRGNIIHFKGFGNK